MRHKINFLTLGAVTCGPYTYLVRMALLSLLILSVSRLGLMIWQYERVAATNKLVEVALRGIRADLILIGLWLIIPVLCVPILTQKRWQNYWFTGTYICSLTGLVGVLFIELSTPAFLLQFDTRPNRLFIEYLRYPKELLSTLWHGFRASFIGGLVLTGLFAYVAH